MPRLTEARVRNAAAPLKQIKLSDGAGLWLLVTPSGSKLWRFRYRFGGRENMTSLGAWPEVSLKQARERLHDARKLVANDIDPAAQRREQRLATANTFKAVATEWLEAQQLSPSTLERERGLLQNHLLPALGSKAISNIKQPDVLAALRPLEKRGSLVALQRARQLVVRVYRFAIASHLATHNPAA